MSDREKQKPYESIPRVIFVEKIEDYWGDGLIENNEILNIKLRTLSELSDTQKESIKEYKQTREKILKELQEQFDHWEDYKSIGAIAPVRDMHNYDWDAARDHGPISNRGSLEKKRTDEKGASVWNRHLDTVRRYAKIIEPLTLEERETLEWVVGLKYATYAARETILRKVNDSSKEWYELSKKNPDTFSFWRTHSGEDEEQFQPPFDDVLFGLDTWFKSNFKNSRYTHTFWDEDGLPNNLNQGNHHLSNFPYSPDMDDFWAFICPYDHLTETDPSKTFLEYFAKYPWVDPEVETKIVELSMPTWWTPQHHDLLQKRVLISLNLGQDVTEEKKFLIEELELAKDVFESCLEGILKIRASGGRVLKETIGLQLRADVLARDEHTCQWCGRKAPEVKLHIDHIKPESKGGTSNLDNLQVLCEECNMGKGNRYDH